MKVSAILEHFLARAPWVDRANTVDRVIAGDPEREVDRCFVTWMPGMRELRRMVECRVPLLICHEPTFWNHANDRPGEDAATQEKMRFILENGLVLLRTHDCWDRWPGIGIPWAWAQFLGFCGAPARTGAEGYQHRYDVPPVSLDALAARVAARCRALGEPAVQVTGPADRTVSKIGIGTGCCCKIATFIEMGCDCSIVCDDGSWYWSNIQRAQDLDHPVIRVHHGTSEEPGMATLTQYVNENLPGLRAELLPHGCTFRMVGA